MSNQDRPITSPPTGAIPPTESRPSAEPATPVTTPSGGVKFVHPPVEAPAPQSPNLSAEPRPGDETVTITLDGEQMTVRKGTNVLEAAKLRGKDICHFCYHPGLSIAASCRQCLVEIEKSPKLVPSCQAPVTEGMVVRTDSEPVLEARRAMLEFTLKNHPVDCPICDKAGECVLQRHYMDHDHTLTRVDVPKIRKPKHKDIGQEIMLDAERCILCSRCIRFCDEVTGTSELTMSWRGDHEQIDIAEGHRLDNPYSLNVVDICPVGALTSKDFRFQVRAWELKATQTTCPGCATGCAVELHHRHEQAYRVVPRLDPSVNGHWMCDEGRYTYKQLDPALRIRQALVDGVPTGLREALAVAARRLEGKKAAVVFSAAATNETNLAASALAEMLGAERFVLGYPPGEADALLRDADKNPNSRGAHQAAGGVTKHEAELALELAGRAYEAVVFIDGTGELNDVALSGLRDVVSICLSDRRTPIADACSIVLPAASWAEMFGTFTNRQGRLRVLRPAWRPEGERRNGGDLLRDLVLALGGRDIGSARDITRGIAQANNHAELLRLLADEASNRPTLLRFAHSRG